MGLTLDLKLTYSTHIHNISVQAHNPLQMIKALTATGWGKQNERLNAMHAVMQNAVLRTTTGCTQDTNIQHMYDETLLLPIHEHIQFNASQFKPQTQHPSHPLHEHTTYFNTPRFKKATIFKNSRYTTNIPTDPHPVTITDIKQTCAIYILYYLWVSSHKRQ